MLLPFKLFKTWFKKALTTPSFSGFEANAMTLATANLMGTVSARVVLLKEIDTTGFVFFTNYNSRKGRQLTENTHAALMFYWPHIGRQIRIEGTVEKISEKESDAYFETRPRLSRVGAHASHQSQEISSRQELLVRYASLKKLFAQSEIPRPEYWGGYRLLPVRMEFWKARKYRIHERTLYTKKGSAWEISILSP